MRIREVKFEDEYNSRLFGPDLLTDCACIIPVNRGSKATLELDELSESDKQKLCELCCKDVEIKEEKIKPFYEPYWSRDFDYFNKYMITDILQSKPIYISNDALPKETIEFLKNLNKEKNMNLEIRNIYYDDTPGKEVVVVIFTDGTKIFKHLSQGDTFDLRSAVAFAVTEKLFGSKTQFRKFVEKKAVKIDKKKKKATKEVNE